MTEPITRGDKYDIPFQVNGDLTGATTRVFVKGPSAVVELTHDVTDPATGAGALTDTSMLPVGSHRIELEALWPSGQRITFPMPAYVQVKPDLGSQP